MRSRVARKIMKNIQSRVMRGLSWGYTESQRSRALAALVKRNRRDSPIESPEYGPGLWIAYIDKMIVQSIMGRLE